MKTDLGPYFWHPSPVLCPISFYIIHSWPEPLETVQEGIGSPIGLPAFLVAVAMAPWGPPLPPWGRAEPGVAWPWEGEGEGGGIKCYQTQIAKIEMEMQNKQKSNWGSDACFLYRKTKSDSSVDMHFLVWAFRQTTWKPKIKNRPISLKNRRPEQRLIDHGDRRRYSTYCWTY